MTFAEIERAFKSYERTEKRKEQKQASFDYILADLIGQSIARCINSANKMPSINAAYPSLFAEEGEAMAEKIQEQKTQVSALRFKLFAQSFNKRF